MTTCVVTAFDDQKTADRAIDALRKEGIEDREIKILKGNADKLMRELAERGFGNDDARGFADAADQGKTLVAARVTDEKADQAIAIMERHEKSQDDDRQDADDDGGRKESGKGKERKGTGREEAVEVVEEEFSVGKRKVANGGVQVTSSVSEQPVEETVSLREEHVEAKRRPADRALNDDEAETAFEEKTVEMMGTNEEVEVRKEARVVGEVLLTKKTKEREQTVRDTVRSTDVEVEEVEPSSRKRK